MNTKEDIISRLHTIIRALDAVSVSGRQNLANLVGSIGTLEDIIAALSQYEFHKIGDE